jgi:hypothetical protein
MTDRLIHLWRWVGAHRLLAGWVAAAVCVLAFSGGVTLGAANEAPAQFNDAAQLGEAVDAPPAVVRSRAVEAVVLRRRGAALIARTAEGERLVIRTNARTTFRHKGKDVEPDAVRRGARVVVLGRPAGEGVIVARVVAVRGWVRLAAEESGPNPSAPFPGREGGVLSGQG